LIPATECRKGSISYDRPRIMGIMNLTPDSFSDEIRYSGSAAVKRMFEMEEEGADVIDVGGMSSKPGALMISAEEESERIMGVIKEAAQSLRVPISVDTMHPRTAEKALDAGASIINDISGLRNDEMMNVVSSAGVPVVIMHMHGIPETMQMRTMTGDVIAQISDFFDTVCRKAKDAGIKKNKIMIDPGIGFGKTHEQNVEIISNLQALRKGYPIMTGTSMKSFLEHTYPDVQRNEASIMSSVECINNGADIVRVHNVKGTAYALKRGRS